MMRSAVLPIIPGEPLGCPCSERGKLVSDVLDYCSRFWRSACCTMMTTATPPSARFVSAYLLLSRVSLAPPSLSPSTTTDWKLQKMRWGEGTW